MIQAFEASLRSTAPFYFQKKLEAEPSWAQFTVVHAEQAEIPGNSKWEVISDNYGKVAAPFFDVLEQQE